MLRETKSIFIILVLSSIFFSLTATDVFGALTWKPYVSGLGNTEDLQFGIISNINGIDVLGPSALESGYNGAYSFPCNPLYTGEGSIFGWGQTFVVSSDRTLSAAQLRISRIYSNTPTGLISVSVSEFNPVTNDIVALVASTVISASNFNEPLGSDVPVFTVDLSASGGQLDTGKTYLLSLTSMGGFGDTAVAPYAATDIYAGGNSYYYYEDAPDAQDTPSIQPIPEPTSIGLIITGLVAFLGIKRKVVTS